MEKLVNIHTAKTTLSRLIAEVENGEEVVIARAGKPVARLVGPRKTKSRARPDFDRKPGFMKGQIKILPGFYDPLPEDIAKAFRGEGD